MKMMPKHLNKWLAAAMACATALLLLACTGGKIGPVVIELESADAEAGALSGKTFVVDAGHGGFDAGTQGVSTGTPEKDVNLSIATKLQAALEAEGAAVVMTRSGEGALAHTKEEDMQARVDTISATQPYMMISIHQNRYGDSSVRGPQVFYLEQGTQAEALARSVQAAMNDQLGVSNPRSALTGEYRLLRPGKGPSIIVECGFLSNPAEEALLIDDAYQNKLVAAIISGVYDYAHSHEEVGV